MRTDEAARYHDTIVKHMCPCHAYACVIGFPEASWRAAFHFAELSGDEMGEGGHNKRANDCRLALHFHGDIEKGKANETLSHVWQIDCCRIHNEKQEHCHEDADTA